MIYMILAKVILIIKKIEGEYFKVNILVICLNLQALIITLRKLFIISPFDTI